MAHINSRKRWLALTSRTRASRITQRRPRPDEAGKVQECLKPAGSWSKRGVYTFITTILFIMVLLLVVFGVMIISAKMGKIQANADQQAEVYNHIQIAKNRILYCYGLTLDELRLNQSCNITSTVVKGYRIKMLPFRNCTDVEKYWQYGDLVHVKNIHHYLVPIRSNKTSFTCPGKLEVFY
jgi:hypothetical protein